MATHTITLEPVAIDAPAEIAWRVLTDLERYPEWNPFTVRVESSLEIGAPVILHIRRGDSTMKQTFVLEVLDPPREIAWRLPKMLHKAIFSAYRTQQIEALDAGRCTYRTSDTFSGLLAGPLYRSQHEWVQRNFTALANALKARAEAFGNGADGGERRAAPNHRQRSSS